MADPPPSSLAVMIYTARLRRAAFFLSGISAGNRPRTALRCSIPFRWRRGLLFPLPPPGDFV